MQEKYLSIITNFGCHWKCSYCIVKNNKLKIPRTTINGLTDLSKSIEDNKVNIVSLSGGGDPCYLFSKNKEWYSELFKVVETPLELHTTYLNVIDFPYNKFNTIVYHLIDVKSIKGIVKYSNEKIRVVFVVDEYFTEEYVNNIVKEVYNNSDIVELSFRQMVDSNYKTTNYLKQFLKEGHKNKWWYIEQDDYNLYYSENKLSTKYEDFKNISS